MYPNIAYNLECSAKY